MSSNRVEYFRAVECERGLYVYKAGTSDEVRITLPTLPQTADDLYQLAIVLRRNTEYCGQDVWLHGTDPDDKQLLNLVYAPVENEFNYLVAEAESEFKRAAADALSDYKKGLAVGQSEAELQVALTRKLEAASDKESAAIKLAKAQRLDVRQRLDRTMGKKAGFFVEGHDENGNEVLTKDHAKLEVSFLDIDKTHEQRVMTEQLCVKEKQFINNLLLDAAVAGHAGAKAILDSDFDVVIEAVRKEHSEVIQWVKAEYGFRPIQNKDNNKDLIVWSQEPAPRSAAELGAFANKLVEQGPNGDGYFLQNPNALDAIKTTMLGIAAHLVIMEKRLVMQELARKKQAEIIELAKIQKMLLLAKTEKRNYKSSLPIIHEEEKDMSSFPHHSQLVVGVSSSSSSLVNTAVKTTEYYKTHYPRSMFANVKLAGHHRNRDVRDDHHLHAFQREVMVNA